MSRTGVPAEVFPPGVFLNEEMEARGWSQCDLAAILRRPLQAVNEILAGKKAIMPETAKELEAAFGVPADYWLNLETAYRLSLARDASDDVGLRAKCYGRVPVREIAKRGWIKLPANAKELEREVLSFLEAPSLDDPSPHRFAARKSGSYGSDTPAQTAWFCRCRHLARSMGKPAPFNPEALGQAAGSLRRLSISDTLIRELPQAFADLGVRLIALGHLTGSKVDGVTFWLDDHSPVIALSLRLDRVDNLWHTLMHEVHHVLEGPNAKQHLDVDVFGADVAQGVSLPPREENANRQACEWLVPQQQLHRFIANQRPYFSQAAIAGFASRVGVHPGIVVGQLHHRREIDFSHNRKLLTKVRHLLPLQT